MTDSPAPIPHSDALELSVIGAVAVFGDDALDDPRVASLVPDDFYNPAHARAWTAILNLNDIGHPIDAHILAARIGDQHLVADAIFQATGGNLHNANPANAPHWAQIIAEHAQCRRLLIPLTEAVDAARDGQLNEARAAVTVAVTLGAVTA